MVTCIAVGDGRKSHCREDGGSSGEAAGDRYVGHCDAAALDVAIGWRHQG